MTTTPTRKRGLTLGEAFAEFVRHPSPWMIASVLFGSLAARIWVGDWALSDLVAPLVYVALFPVMTTLCGQPGSLFPVTAFTT